MVRQRNEATESFRQLQERFSALEGNVQQMQQPQHQEQPAQEQEQPQYYDEYGNPAATAAQSPDLVNLRTEFDQYREAQVIEQVKGQLETEIQEALATHSGVDGNWLRTQLIDRREWRAVGLLHPMQVGRGITHSLVMTRENVPTKSLGEVDRV